MLAPPPKLLGGAWPPSSYTYGDVCDHTFMTILVNISYKNRNGLSYSDVTASLGDQI